MLTCSTWAWGAVALLASGSMGRRFADRHDLLVRTVVGAATDGSGKEDKVQSDEPENCSTFSHCWFVAHILLVREM